MNVSTRTSKTAMLTNCPSTATRNNNTKSAQFMRWLFLLLTVASFSVNVNAQTLIDPAGDGGFNNGTTLASNGWTVANYASSTNQWVAGTAVSTAPFSGRSAYISNTGGTTNAYDNTSTNHVYFYRDVAIPSGSNYISLSFNLISNGEASWDMMQVFIAPTSVTPVAGPHPGSGTALIPTDITGATQLGFYQTITTVQTASLVIPASYAGQTIRLIFMWKNDGSVGTNPPAAVDNISLVASASIPTFTASSIGGLWSSPATWSGGAVPGPGADVDIPAGAIVTIDQAVTVRNLSVSGSLQWNGTSNAMTASGNILINAGGNFLAYTTGGVGQTLTVGGNFTNNGYANLAMASTALTFNGAGSTLSGTGTFQGNGTDGIIRFLSFSNLGSNTISTTQNIITTSFVHSAGSLNTNGKLKIDNTVQVYGLPLNLQVASVAVTAQGSLYSVAPVVFGASVTQWTNITGALNALYVSGNNVYRCVVVGNIGPAAPTHTAGIAQNLLWIGTVGTLGNPFLGSQTHSVGTQYFYGGNLYVCTVAASAAAAATPPVHTLGTAVSGGCTFLYVGTPAAATVTYDAATQTVRSLSLTSAGSGYSSAPTVAFSVGVAAGTGSGASATAVYIQQVAGTASSLTQKTTGTVITGGIAINSDQGASIATLNGQASSGVGNISAASGGVNYTIAPTIGFAGPSALNLVTNGGSGYASAPTITVDATNLVSGTNLISSAFTITMNQGKIVSVYLTSPGTAVYSAPPTLTLSSVLGGAAIAFPAGCWPTATATIGSNGQLTNFTVTNAGYGYVAAPSVGVGPTSGNALGGTYTSAVGAITARVALYNLTFNFFAPATVASQNADDASIPVNRKINVLSLNGNGVGIALTSNLTLFGSSPLALVASGIAPGNVIDLGGNNLYFSWNGYTGTTSTFGVTNTYIKNGSMTLTGKGGVTSFNYPFSGTFSWSAGTTPTPVTTGSTVTKVTVTETAAPTGAAAIGTRAFRVVTDAGSIYGTNPTVTMNYNSADALTGNAQDLFISQSAALSGAWTPRSLASGSGALPATGNRTTATTGLGPIVPTGNDFFAWTTISTSFANVTVPTGTCTPTAHAISADVTTSGGTITSVTITYNNGAVTGPVAMNNPSGNTWTYTIPVASPGNAVVTWSITATNSFGIVSTFTGNNYQDDPFNGASASATGTPNPVCAGSNVTLTGAVTKPTTTGTIGAAITLTTATTQPTAFCNRWGSYRMQTVFTGAELLASGLTSGNLSSMTFNITTLGDAATNSGFSVRIGTTALSTLTAFADSTVMTQVFNPGVYTHVVGVNTMNFSNPFYWDGLSNIIVQVVHNGANATNNSLTYYTATAGNTVAYTSTASSNAASLSTNRLNVTFTSSGVVPVITTYTWNDGFSNIGTGNPFIANPTTSTTYTVTAVNAAGCSIVSPGITINTTTLPNAPTGGNSTQCGNQIPTANVVSGGQNGQFRWYSAASGGTLLQGPSAATTYGISVGTTTTFYVSESANVDGSGCESLRSPVTVTVNQPDAVSATPSDANPCSNTAITLTAANIAGAPINIYTYNWTATPQVGSGIPIGGTPGTSISVTPTIPGTYVYTVNAVDGSCATSATTVNVVVKSLPNILSATATPASFCNGGSSNLVATTISAAAGFSTVGTSTTTIGGSDGNPYRSGNGTGNQIRTQLLVTAAQLTAAGIAPGNITSLGFTTTGVGGTVDNLTIKMGATAATVLSTTFETTSMTTVFTQASFTAVLGLNTHTFSTPFTWNGTSNIIVNVCQTNNVLGTNTVSAFTPPTSSNIHKSGSVTGCTDLTGTVVATMPIMTFGAQIGSVGAGSLTWTWNPGSLSGNTQTVTPSITTTYTVSAYDPATTCTKTQDVLVTVYPIPAPPTANTGDDICGTGLPNISLASNSGAGTPKFRWYNALTSGTLLQDSTLASYATPISATTTFYVTEISAFGCESSPRVAVTQNVNTPDAVTAQANLTSTALSICIGSSFNLSALQTGGNGNTYAFTWTATGGTNSGITGSVVGNPVTGITPLAAGVYTYNVVAYDDNTFCTVTSSVTVTVNANPVITAATATPSTVCAGSAVTLNGQSVVASLATAQIGNGTGSNSSSTTIGAFYGTWYGNGHAQLLITASELTAAGFVAGNLTDLKVDVSALAAAPDNVVTGFTISLASVSAATTAITTFQAPTFTTVYGPTTYTPVLGTNTHTFAAPYNWDGVSNIIVDYCFANGILGGGSAVNTFTTTAFGSFVNYQVDNAATPCTVTTVSNASTNRPNVKFTGQVGINYTASLTWEWTPGPVAGSTVVVNPTVTTDYTVKATTAAGCFITYSPVHVDVNALPNPPVGTNSTQCGPGVPTASVSTGGSNGTYRWYDALTGGTLLQTGGSTYTTSISGTGIHNFYVSENNGTCESTRTLVTVTITAPPTVAITPGGVITFCAGGSVSLDAATPSDPSYTGFAWSPALGLNTTSGGTVTATPAVTTTYTVTATGAGCTNTASVTITVNPNPVIDSIRANPASICLGGTSNLSVYSVGIGTGPQSLPGTYCVPVQSGSSTVAGVVLGTINNTGIVQASPYYDIYPASGSTTTNLTAGQTYPLTLTTTGASIISVWIDYDRNGTFDASEWIQPWTSASTGTVNITVPISAAAGQTGMRIRSRLNGNTNGAGDGCSSFGSGGTADYTVNIIGVSTQNPAFTYLWSNGATTPTTGVSPTSTTSYTVTVTDPTYATNCSTVSAPVTVTLATVAGAPSASPATICAGGSSTLSANATGGAPFTYLWNDPAASTTATINVSPATTTTYTVVITDACGNPTSALPVTVTVNPLPTSSIAETGPISICAPLTQVLTVQTDAGSATYQWTLNGVNIPAATGATYTVSAVSSGSYRVIVTNTATGCPSAPSAAVSVTIKASPTSVTAVASVNTICAGDPLTLTGSAATPSPSILTQDFEAGLGAWTITNSSGGTTPLVVPFILQSNPYTSANSTPVTFNSGAGSQMIIANADLGGSGTTVNTQLTSPTFSTMGYSTLNLSYDQYYRQYLTSANVDVSIDGGTSWITVKTYTATQGAPAAFATDNVDLSAYVNNANVKIRFNYSDGWAWYWALDNIAVTGTAPAYTYAWTSTPAGFTSAVQNPTGVTPLVSTTYNLSVNAANGCSTTANTGVVTVNQCPSTLNATAFLQGFYNGASSMVANKYDLGLSVDPTETDDISINLWAPTSLANALPDYTATAVLHTNGTATVTFPAGLGGQQFYVAIKHRNHLETWSKLPITFKPIVGYNFSSGLTQAYDDGLNPPMASMGSGVFAFYGGDVNQDGTVDISDAIDVQNNANIFAFGYDATDATGDGATDLADAIIVQNNGNLFLFYARPY